GGGVGWGGGAARDRSAPQRQWDSPPTSPPPPIPWNRPFQPFVGRATNTLTRHPVGGCVTVARTRQDPSAALSSTESMVVLGSATLARSSWGITGAPSATAGLGGASPTWGRATAAGRATRTVSIPRRSRVSPNLEGRAIASVRVACDGIILAGPHEALDCRRPRGSLAVRLAASRATC